jgi:intraflagellar transport protein 20
LQAIGQRNKVDSEQENRERQKKALHSLINEKMAELDRFTKQYNSLVKIEQDQNLMIERLESNEA